MVWKIRGTEGWAESQQYLLIVPRAGQILRLSQIMLLHKAPDKAGRVVYFMTNVVCM